ncbi:MAG: hypothetical protein LC737_02205, partial [Chloroflexi bacterium]|nr:hypothetical protein [Chloroflexota bacterium]
PTLVITHHVTTGGLGPYTGAISVTNGVTLTVAAFSNLSAAGDVLNDGSIVGPAQQFCFRARP